MKYGFILFLTSCGAQFFDNGNDEVGTFIQQTAPRGSAQVNGPPKQPPHRGPLEPHKQKAQRNRAPPQQVLASRIPDIVVERNGDSQFNSGPLGLSQKHALSKEKHNIAQPLRSGVSPRKHAHRHEDQHSGQYPPLGRQPNNVHPRPNEPRSDDVQNESEDGFHRSETKSFQDAPIVLSGPVLELQGHTSYVYPEKAHPLKQCFYNPSGYACCNRNLNDEMVRTFEFLASQPDYSPCNTQKLANTLQRNCARRFKMNFEAIVGLADYAQRVNFKKDLVCKVELGGRYMLVYATPDHDAERRKRGDEKDDAVEDDTALKLIDRSVSTFENATDIGTRSL